MVSCANHPGVDAVLKCRKCGRSFCLSCLEEVGEFHYCFSCLKSVSRDARSVYTGKLTASLIVGTALCVAIGVMIFLTQLDNFVALVNALGGGPDAMKTFLAPSMLATLAPVALGVAMFTFLAIGLVQSKKWALQLAVVLGLMVIVWRLVAIASGSKEPIYSPLILIIGPIVVMAIAYINRENLRA